MARQPTMFDVNGQAVAWWDPDTGVTTDSTSTIEAARAGLQQSVASLTAARGNVASLRAQLAAITPTTVTIASDMAKMLAVYDQILQADDYILAVAVSLCSFTSGH